jgi:hypothetical protein
MTEAWGTSIVSERTGLILDFDLAVDRDDAEDICDQLNGKVKPRGFRYVLAKVVLVDE